jgi:hypothetical protein
MTTAGGWMERVLLGTPLYCVTCGTAGHPKRVRKGSFTGEVLLWVIPTVGLLVFWPFALFYMVALTYSIWRLAARRPLCAACRSEAVIPLTAPKAIGHLRPQVYRSEPPRR